MEKNFLELRRYIIIFLCIIIIMTLMIASLHFAPFGSNTMAAADAYIQYLQFFAYMKDILCGENNIFYSFSTGIGQGNIGIFTYYLMSPINLLLVFFSKDNLHTFYNISVVIKMALSGTTMAFFIQRRFNGKISFVFQAILSFSYAFMQYNLAQSENIMWMDGVYMLPLILLAIHKLVVEKKHIPLVVTVCISILIQWYTAGINCLFACIWFFVEIALSQEEQQKNMKELFFCLVRFCFAMAEGVLMSAVLFLPTIINMLGGKGKVDDNIFTNVIRGPIASVIWNYTNGGLSSANGVSLYAGCFVLITCIGVFFLKPVSKEKKMAFIILLVLVVAIFYWQPFFGLFSLFKSATSYWYRYSYIGIFSLIFISAYFLANWIKGTIKDSFFIAFPMSFSIILFCLNAVVHAYDEKQIVKTAVLAIMIGLILYVMNGKQKKAIMTCCLITIVIGDLLLNARVLMLNYKRADADVFSNYNLQEMNQINAIKKTDSDFFRISQSVPRASSKNITPHYDEAMAFNYWGISSYTSCPSNLQLSFLNKLGYCEEAECISIVNTPILPVDSLLGVKYILSPLGIDKLKLLKDLPEATVRVNEKYTSKKVYENPYALPIAFVYRGENCNLNSDNPFENINSIYKAISKENTDVFNKLEYTQDKNEKFQIKDIPEKNTVYGLVQFDQRFDNCLLNVNQQYIQKYAGWLAPSVFWIPISQDDSSAQITVSAEKDYQIKQAQFYAMDSKTLRKISDEINCQDNGTLKMSNGHIKWEGKAQSGDSLLITVIADKGWRLKVNGKKEPINTFADALISVPLEEGENLVELRYSVPGLKAGFLISVISLLLFATQILIQRKNNKNLSGYSVNAP